MKEHWFWKSDFGIVIGHWPRWLRRALLLGLPVTVPLYLAWVSAVAAFCILAITFWTVWEAVSDLWTKPDAPL